MDGSDPQQNALMRLMMAYVTPSCMVKTDHSDPEQNAHRGLCETMVKS